MMTLQRLITNLKSVEEGLQRGKFVREALIPRADEIMTFQYQQLFEGKASNGEDIRPYYSEDVKPNGYFRSKESADRYIAWKQTGIPYPFRANRNPDAPNLFITGKFHEELKVDFGSDTMTIKGGTSYADGIVAKYGIGTFGLTAESWGEMINERGVGQDVMNEVIKTINA